MNSDNQVGSVSKEFGKAAMDNIGVQVLFGIFCSLITDTGVLNLWLISCFAYWVAFAFVRFRRPIAPSRFDLQFLKFGVFILFAFAILAICAFGILFTGKG